MDRLDGVFFSKEMDPGAGLSELRDRFGVPLKVALGSGKQRCLDEIWRADPQPLCKDDLVLLTVGGALVLPRVRDAGVLELYRPFAVEELILRCTDANVEYNVQNTRLARAGGANKEVDSVLQVERVQGPAGSSRVRIFKDLIFILPPEPGLLLQRV